MKYLLFMILVPFIGLSQKVKYNKDTHMISIDGKEEFKIEKSGCGLGTPDCHFDIHNLKSEKVIRVNYRTYQSPVYKTEANPNGKVQYFEYIFLKSGGKAEAECLGLRPEKVAKFLWKNDLLKNGDLDEAAAKQFALVHGTPYSQRIKF